MKNKEPALLKYHAYKKIYRRRKKPTPSGRSSWGQWFKVKFGEDIEIYHKRVKRKQDDKAAKDR